MIDKITIQSFSDFISNQLPKIKETIEYQKSEIHRFKDYDAKINREIITKPWEFVKQKINEYKGLVETYLTNHKGYLQKVQK